MTWWLKLFDPIKPPGLVFDPQNQVTEDQNLPSHLAWWSRDGIPGCAVVVDCTLLFNHPGIGHESNESTRNLRVQFGRPCAMACGLHGLSTCLGDLH